MGLRLITPPAIEPLSIAEVSTHLRLDATNAEPAPGALVSVLGSGAGLVTNGAHRYVVTFVTSDGETQAGAASVSVTVVDQTVNGNVALTSVPLGGATVTSRKLYRTQAGGSTFLLLATIADNTTTTYPDNTADASLGAGAPANNSTGDPYLRALIQASREYAEMYTRRALINQGWRLTLDSFPAADTIELPRAPLVSVDSITYIDPSGVSTALDPALYSVDSNGLVGRIVLNYARLWPFTRLARNSVTINFTAGFGTSASAVPASIGHAMKLLVGHWYSTRETFVSKRFALEVPFAVDALLTSQRVLEAA